MSEAQSILVVFALLYLSECILWISSDAVCLTGFGRWLHPAWRPEVLGNRRRQVFVLSLWPGSRSAVALPWRIMPGEHKLALQSPSRGWLTVDYPVATDIESSGTGVRLGDLTIDLQSASQATVLSRFLRRLSNAPASQRPAMIAQLIQRACDPSRARRVMSVTNRRLYSLRQLSGLLLLWTFVAGPVFYMFSDRSLEDLIRFCAVYLALWWLCAVAAFRSHRRLVPSLARDRWSSLALSLISPPHAIRESDRVLVHRARELHPLATAMATMQEQELLRVARTDLAQLRYPLFRAPEQTPDATVAEAEEIVREVDHQLADVLTAALLSIGFSPEQLQCPEEQHPDAVCWCPRCFNQYTQRKDDCDDCPGVALISFAETSADGPTAESDQPDHAENH